MTRLTHPSIKQRKFAKVLVATGRKDLALKAAYDLGKRGGKGSKESLNSMANNVLANAMVQDLVQKELDKVGLKEGKVAKKLNQIIDSGTLKSKLKHSNPKLALQALDMVNKMRGSYAPERKQIDRKSQNLNVNLQGKNMSELLQEVANLQSQMKDFQKIVERDVKEVKEVEEVKNETQIL